MLPHLACCALRPVIPAKAGISTLFALTLLFTLSACGFEAVHSKHRANQQAIAAPILSQVTVDVLGPKRLAQLFRVALEDQTHPENRYSSDPRYRVDASITEVKQAIVIEQDASITRFNLIFTVDYQLSDLETGEILLNRQRQRISSYNVSESDFATYINDRDARERGARELAETLAREIAIALTAQTQEGDS